MEIKLTIKIFARRFLRQ